MRFQSILLANDYSNATADVASLCKQMPFMSGCSIYNSCNSRSSNSPYCAPFSILADICYSDMPRMKACSNYKSMCDISSTGDQDVPLIPIFSHSADIQCKQHSPISLLPSTINVNNLVKSICSEMNMDGCESCLSVPGKTFLNCDLFAVYSNLCYEMPNMYQCLLWKSLCQVTPLSNYCIDSSNLNPIMRMYFHTGYSDYLLFKSWVPRSGAQYIAAIIILFLVSFLYELLLVWNVVWEASLNSRSMYPFKSESVDIEEEQISLHSGILVIVCRFGFKIGITVVGYSLMLIAMTFNVGFFLAVVFGYALGYSLFHGLARKHNHITHLQFLDCC